MGKKRQRAKQVSKGIHHQKPNRWVKMARREWNGSDAQHAAKLQAFMAGKNVMLTVPNPDKNNTKERFIRVNAKEVWRQASKK